MCDCLFVLCSGEKLVCDKWPESIQVKGKVRLEAFEKYVKDLPRSRNRGLMVNMSSCFHFLVYLHMIITTTHICE